MHSVTRTALRTALRRTPTAVPSRAVRRLDQDLIHYPATAVAQTRHGSRFLVHTSDIIQRYLYMFGTWEPHLSAWIRRRLKTGDTFVDVGANIGYYTMLASQRVGPTGRVVAIEPSPRFLPHLRAAVQLNQADNVRTVSYAVAAEPGQVEMYMADPGNPGGTSMVKPRLVHASFHTSAMPLAAIVTPAEIRSARLIKIDVEGAEAAAVQSLSPLLDLLRPDAELIIEVTPRTLAKQGLDVQDVITPLRQAGFHTYRIVNDYDATTYPAAIDAPEPPRRWERQVTEMSDLVFSRTDSTHV